jgi:TolA-binding protein
LIELRLADDFRDEGEIAEDDDARIARAIEGALSHDAVPVPRRRNTLSLVMIAAAVLVTVFAWARWSRSPEPSSPPVTEPAPVASTSVAVTTASAAPIEEAEPVATASATTTIEKKPPIAPSNAYAPSAAELFAMANDARRLGRTEEAVAGYRRLQKEHPSSAEATTSRVALGRLLLDKLSDATAARGQFAGYLAASPDGTLAEEARAGLALSAMKLGDTVGERSAWQELLAKHPDSVHAARARKRLAELAP